MKEARVAERADAREEDVDLGLLEHRGRLVEEDDEMAAGGLLERQRLGDLDHLPGGEVELVGAGARVDVEPDLGELAGGGGVEPLPVDDAEPG